MIQEAYCSFGVAKLLKEKGFNECCDNYYDKNDSENQEPQELTWDEIMYSFDKFLKAPTQQMAMRWLREEKRIFIRIIEDCTGEVFRYEIYNHTPDNNGKYYISNTYADSYEKAVEEALKYCLEKLI